MRKYLHFLVKSIITNIRNRRNGGEKIMKKKWLKKGSAVLLAAAMVLSVFPGMKGTLATVQAATENTEPASEYWTDAEGLKNFGISSTKTIGKIRFGLNGSDARLWAICGRMEVTLHYFQPASLHKTNMVEPVNIQRVIL